MNKTFKVIFSKARNALMVVNEATGSVQAKGTKTVIATAIATALMASGTALAADRIVVEADATETIESEANFSELTSSEFGGAISNAGTLTVGNNTTFDGNKAQIGGAISNNGTLGNAVATIGDNVTFSNNTSEHQGGAIHNQKADLTIGDDAKFTGNKSELVGSAGGGAIYVDTDGSKAASVTLGDRAIFEKNSAKNSGGAIYVYSADSFGGNELASFEIGTDSQFKNNSANRGGAVASFASNASIGANAVFSGNTAETDGGAIYSSGHGSTAAKLNLGDNAKFVNNIAKDNGGAVFNGNDSTLTIKNATFANNWAGDKLNDIHNDGSVEVSGVLTLEGGISGEGTTHFLAESTLNVIVGMNLDQSTTITNSVVVDDGAALSFTFAPGYAGEYQLFASDVQGEFDVDLENNVFDVTMNKDGEFVVSQKSAEDIAKANIEKLAKRYPDGFSKERSLNRED